MRGKLNIPLGKSDEPYEKTVCPAEYESSAGYGKPVNRVLSWPEAVVVEPESLIKEIKSLACGLIKKY